MNILELHNVTFGFIAGMFHYIQKGQLGFSLFSAFMHCYNRRRSY